MSSMTKKKRVRPWQPGTLLDRWTDHDEVNALRDGDDELELHILGDDATARGRAAERLLGPAARGAVRR